MNADPLTDFSRLCVHTITTKGWDLEEAVDHYALRIAERMNIPFYSFPS